MNAAHFHLVVNHSPLFLLIFGTSLLGFGLLRESRAASFWGTVVLVAAASLSAASFFSGEGAEDILKAQPNWSESMHEAVETHEEASQLALIASGAVGGLALLGFWLQSRRRAAMGRGFQILAIGAGVIALGLVVRASNLGGEIHHPEIHFKAR